MPSAINLLTPALLAAALVISPQAVVDPAFATLLLAAVLLEGMALRLPGWGVYAASYVPLLALASSSGGGIRWALAGMALVWLWRGLRWGFELAAPEGVALAACALLAGALGARGGAAVSLVCALTYLGCETWLSQWLARRKLGSQVRTWLGLQRLVQEVRGLGLLLMVGLALAHPDWRLLSFFLIPLLAGYRAVSYGMFRLQSREANQVLAEADRLQASVDAAHRGEHSARLQLSATHEQRKLLEEMTRALSSESRWERAALQLFGLLNRHANYTSLALIARDGEGWVGLACHSPHSARLTNHRLLNYREPLWDQVRRAGMALVLREDAPDRIFPGELAALAVPLGDNLLYLGRNAPMLTESECHWIMWVADQARPLLEAIHQRQRQQSALIQTQAQSDQLQGQVTALSGLLEASRLLASSLDRQSMGQLVEQACLCVFPGTEGSLWLRPDTAERNWGAIGSEDAARVAQAVHSRRPWADKNMLIHPLGSFPGALLIRWPDACAEDRQLQEQMGLLAASAGLAIANAEHLRLVVEAQAQVLQSSKMAAVGQLAAGVAHELNSPLGAIALSLSVVTPNISDEGAQRKLERATKAAERCRTIIQKLFIYTRLGSAQSERLRLETAVEDALNFVRSNDLAGAEVRVVVQQSALVNGRGLDLHELLTNLLLNANEAYPASSPARKIQITCLVEQNWAVVLVRDWGAGMDAATLERACEPFFTTKAVGSNVGLGLSVAREIARQHGGELSLESAPGQGCQARLRLPQVQS